MTWTYSGNPAASDRDMVRFLIGDTDTTDQLATDEEIAWAVNLASNNYEAAAEIARGLAAKFARYTSTSIDGISMNYGEKAKQFSELAATLDKEGSAFITALPYAGGTSISDMAAVSADADRPKSIMDPVEVK
jgi:hypothetical protein